MGEMTVEKSAEVKAPARAIWDQLMDVRSWPEWKPFMKKAGIASGYDALSSGSKVKMSLMIGGPAALPISATITEFNRPEKLSWEGGLKGVFHAVHSFEIKDQGGKCMVTSRETFTGALLGLVLLLVTREDLEALHQSWVGAIKKRLEGETDGPEQADAHGH